MTVGQVNSVDNRKWLVLSAVSVGTFISTLRGSIVNISLPTIAHDFEVGIPEIEWIVVAYLLTAGSLLLTFGRLGDVIGYRRVSSDACFQFWSGSPTSARQAPK